MKTTSIPRSGICIPAPALPRLFRLAAVVSSVVLVMAAPLPRALAGGADGVYRLTRVSGSLSANGETVTLPKDLLKAAFLRNGRILVEGNKVPIYRSKWAGLVDEFNYLGFTGTAEVSGPSNLELRKSGDAYVGSTTRPVTVKLQGDFMGTDVTIVMKVFFKGKIVGNTLTITCPMTVKAVGILEAEGTIKLVTTRG